MAENTSCGINGGNRSETHPMDIAAKSATEQMVEELQRILDLAVPAKEEISKLKNVNQSKQINKETKESDITKYHFEQQRKLTLAYEENSKLQQQLKDVEKMFLANHEEEINTIKEVNLKLGESALSKTEHIGNLQDELNNLKVKTNFTIEEKNQQNKELNDFVQQLKIEKENVVREYSEAKSSFEKLLAEKNEEIEKLQISKVDLKKRARTFITDKEQENKELRDALQQTKTEKENVSKELSDTKSRLSKLMGDKLSDNNPDIADLSDENRPTKLAEKYQELYDNQWTDAFEKAEVFYPNKTEKSRISVLLKILKNVYQFCQDEIAEQERDFVKAMFRTNDTNEKLHAVIPAGMRSHMKELKRYGVSGAIGHLSEKYHKNCDKANEIGMFIEHIQEFVLECITLCWHMVHQNPQVVLNFDVNSGDKFDGSMYKQYTVTGPVVDFVVWPALLLCDKGSVLSKGVVQCVRSFKGSQSVRVRSKKVNTLDMGIPTSSVRFSKPTVHSERDAGDLLLTQSDVKRTDGKLFQSNHAPTAENVHNRSNVQNDVTVKSSQHGHSDYSHVLPNDSIKHKNIPAQTKYHQSSANISQDSQITAKNINSNQPTVDSQSQHLLEHNSQRETAVDYVQQFRVDEEQSQRSNASLKQNTSHGVDTIHTQPNSNNVNSHYPHNVAHPYSSFQQNQPNVSSQHHQHMDAYAYQQQNQPNVRSQHHQHMDAYAYQQQNQPNVSSQHHQHMDEYANQQQNQPNVSSQHQQSMNALQCGSGIGQVSNVQNSTSVPYAYQDPSMWRFDNNFVQEYNTFISLFNFYGNLQQVRTHMGAQVFDRCNKYYLWAMSVQSNQNR